ncbi:MAG: pilus assembly protein [Firmicutes bacterium]|nr:pilus assembly protein [Bacillota bacterium]
MRLRFGPRSGRKGQALVEFALLLPVALFLALGVLALMLLVDAAYTVQHAADVAAAAYSATGSCSEAKQAGREAVGEGIGLQSARAQVTCRRAAQDHPASGDRLSDHGMKQLTVRYAYRSPIPLPFLPPSRTLVRSALAAPPAAGSSPKKDHHQDH